MKLKGKSVLWFSGEKEDLPEETIRGVRIVFLDILLAGIQVNNRKNIHSKIIAVLNKIISKNGEPFLLITWTKHQDKFDNLTNFLCEEGFHFVPVKLDKLSCQDENGVFRSKLIEHNLDKMSQDFGPLRIFFLWENIIQNATCDIIKDFTNFYPFNEKWNDEMSSLFKALATHYAGKQMNEGDNNELLKQMLLPFTRVFLDKIDNEIREININEVLINDVSEAKEKKYLGEINFRLNISNCQGNIPRPGNVYLTHVDYIKIEISDIYDGDINKSPKKSDIEKVVKHITLEVSPICDFVQNKWKVHRILHGFLWPEKYVNKIKKNTNYLYKSDYFISYNNELYYFVFDFRNFYSLDFGDLDNWNLIFRMKQDQLNHIQNKFSSHINRPGLIYLQ